MRSEIIPWMGVNFGESSAFNAFKLCDLQIEWGVRISGQTGLAVAQEVEHIFVVFSIRADRQCRKSMCLTRERATVVSERIFAYTGEMAERFTGL